MDIILFAFIFIIIVFIISKYSISIENITNTQKINSLDIDTNLSTTNFNLANEIEYDNNTSLSYMPNETTCNKDLSSYPKELIYHNSTFNLIGTAINKFYNQKYYLYESKIDQNGDLLITENLDYLNHQIYKYLFVIFDDTQAIIHQEFGPRNKIDIGDIIYIDIKYLNNRISYIGPYLIL